MALRCSTVMSIHGISGIQECPYQLRARIIGDNQDSGANYRFLTDLEKAAHDFNREQLVGSLV